MTLTTRSLGHRHNAGIGYIYIPSDKDPIKFIEKCFRSGTVSIILENGGLVDNVLVSKSIFNELDFPKKSSELGSMVCWVNKPENNQPIVIASLFKSNELPNLSNGRGSLKKSSISGFAEVSVDAITGNITIISKGNTDKGGDINIINTNKSKSSKLNINVSGDININSNNFQLTNSKKIELIIKDKLVDNNVTSIYYEKTVGFGYIDEFGNQVYINKDNIQLFPNKILNIGSGAEPIPLANTLSDILEKLVDLCSNIADEVSTLKVSTAMGPSSIPINASKLSTISSSLSDLKNQFINFKSKISNTD